MTMTYSLIAIYKEVVYDTVKYEKPAAILAEIEKLKNEIMSGMSELKMLIS